MTITTIAHGFFGPMSTVSLGEKKYGFVVTDDFSRYTYVFYLTHKGETFKIFKKKRI